MSESAETAPESTNTEPTHHFSTPDSGDRRTRHLLAWVGIAAGVVFIVAVIFFSGFALGRASGFDHSWHRGYSNGQMGPAECPMMRNGGMMGPGGMGSGGMGPGGMGPGTMQPGPASAPPR
ncbi:hypothetical protein [Mycolicibacterium sp.]|uniref:hypothetical protein n=1 Tax=Mycolicibacterium sp. TaxID=2320850 RepID=UPI0028B0D402|nr:hypothetical protein [Mycolicibacterium sp.]